MRRMLAIAMVVAFCAALYGCNTFKGACKGAKEGAKQDWNGTCTGIKGSNNWIKKNLW